MLTPAKKRARFFTLLAATLGGVVLFSAASRGAENTPDAVPQPANDAAAKPTLYCIGYSHLDTQWRWSYPQVISEYLRSTLNDNFKLFEKYPHYIFNFTGSNRYMMFKEYYPHEYAKLKDYIAAGRWFPAGSSVEEGDVNMPDGEAIIRQVLYGNEYFRKEFGKQSQEYMLPDCFGFQASLPSLLAHCGLTGFSTQKLTWGSAVGIPFNVGVWEGPDGKSIIAALNPGAYDSPINEDLSHSQKWKNRINENGKKSGVYVDYRYYGVGDRGGSPREPSVKLLEQGVTTDGPVKVVSAKADQMFLDLKPNQIAALPRYKGDLLLTGHSTGELTSEAFMKRCERKIENLADAAERSSVAADWLGSAAYPMEKINAAWTLALGAQFHDTMAGTALPKSYEYSWNNEILSLNQFAAATEDGVGGVIHAMDTRTQGVPVVVYNPLATDRQDVAEATVALPPGGGDGIQVLGPDGVAVPAQVVSRDGNNVKILFLAKAPSVGYAVYQVMPGAAPAQAVAQAPVLKVTENSLENERFKVTIDADGDIASVFDKTNNRETLSAPARLEFLYENPVQWPAWNMDYKDRSAAPRGYVTGPCKVRIVENGPARVAIEIERTAQGSRFVQQVRLAAGEAGNQVEVVSKIDWHTTQSSLEAVMPLAAGNPMATYESQSAAVQRGNNDPKKFEVPQQQWLDVTGTDGAAGTAVLNDSKYGSDKPDDHTVRLTLLYTPGVQGGYQDQGSQDLGRHEMVYAIAPHSGSWQQAGVPWAAQRLNQPLLTFLTPKHDGPLGKSFAFCRINNPQVTATAIKKAEDGDEIIIRLHELTGQPAGNVNVTFAGQVESAREVDGQEREIGPATIQDGKLKADLTPFALRAFAVKLAKPSSPQTATASQAVKLSFDLDAISSHEVLNDGSFDDQGRTFPAESMPKTIVSEGISFDVGPMADGQKNAVVCKGQSISIPAGSKRVYVLAAAVNGDAPATFKVGDQPQQCTVNDWSGYIGQWDNRLWQGVVPGLTYDWKNRLAGLAPGYIKRETVAWFCSHRHHPESGNEYYKFTYLFKYGFDVPAGATSLTLPDNDRVRVFAVTTATESHDDARAARPLYDTLQDHVADGAPSFSPAGGKFNDATLVTINPPMYFRQGGLHYTTDGTEPTAESPVYIQPFVLNASATVKACEVDAAGHASASVSTAFDVNDTTAPKVTSVDGVAGLATISIAFNEPVRKDQAEVVGHYQLQPALKVRSAALADDGTHVMLTLAEPPTDAAYTLGITGVTDLSPNANAVAGGPMPVSFSRSVFKLDSFHATGEAMEKRVEKLPVKAGDAWTLNFFVKTASQPRDMTVIAGFGRNSDKDSVADGSGRYLTKFAQGIHFWSRNTDADTGIALDLNRWQMLTATYDGHALRVFKNGEKIGEEQMTLADDEPVVRLAPLDPWSNSKQFKGEIRDLSIWSGALPGDTLKTLAASMPQAK